MKRILLIIVILLFGVTAHADTNITLGWDYSAESEATADGFTLYYAAEAVPAAWIIAVPTIAVTLREQEVVITADTECQYFMLRAFRGSLESGNSNVVEWCPTIPEPDPDTPGGLFIK